MRVKPRNAYYNKTHCEVCFMESEKNGIIRKNTGILIDAYAILGKM